MSGQVGAPVLVLAAPEEGAPGQETSFLEGTELTAVQKEINRKVRNAQIQQYRTGRLVQGMQRTVNGETGLNAWKPAIQRAHYPPQSSEAGDVLKPSFPPMTLSTPTLPLVRLFQRLEKAANALSLLVKVITFVNIALNNSISCENHQSCY